MPERTYRDVDIDLDDLADAVVDWFERDKFEVQDFQEGPSIFVQARKQNVLTMVSGTGKALNVRLSPLSRGFKVEIAAGDWLDKGVGAGVALAARAIFLPLAIGAAAATGYGIYQQLRLPEELLDFIDSFVDRRGVDLDQPQRSARRSSADPAEAELDQPQRSERRSTPAPADVEEELESMRRRRGERGGEPAEPEARPSSRATKRFCPQCGAEVSADARFCHACGQSLRPPAADDDSTDE